MISSSHIIHIKNLHKNHGQNESFSLYMENFYVRHGELVALVGPSGCGKSTALDIISTALEPQTVHDSEFVFHPEEEAFDILSLWKKDKINTLSHVRQKYIGYILQTGGLLPFLSGYDNIMLSCTSNTEQEALQDAVDSMAQQLDITHLLRKKPAQMSVGERQRFAIARALIHKPQLILADEPVASLDPYNAQLVLELFIQQAKEKNISVVMVSHSPTMAKAAGFRLVEATISRQEGQIFSHMHMPSDTKQAKDSPVGTCGEYGSHQELRQNAQANTHKASQKQATLNDTDEDN